MTIFAILFHLFLGVLALLIYRKHVVKGRGPTDHEILIVLWGGASLMICWLIGIIKKLREGSE